MKILKFILLLIIPVLVADQVISLVMEKLYKNTYTGQTGGNLNNLLAHHDHVSVLAMGNSKTAHHVVPELIGEDAFNLSHNGMSLIYHTGLIDQLLRNEEIKIDTILLHLDWDEILEKSDIYKRDIQHLKYYYSKNDFIRNKINTLSKFEAVKFAFASYKWNGKVMNIINNRIKSDQGNIPENGYVPALRGDRDSLNVIWSYERKMAAYKAPNIKEVNSELREYIDYLINLCNEKNVTLIFFTSPIYHPEKINERSSNVVHQFFESRKIIYLNYYNSFENDNRFVTYHFWKDVNHLNHEGAMIFTNILRTDLNGLNLQNEHREVSTDKK